MRLTILALLLAVAVAAAAQAAPGRAQVSVPTAGCRVSDPNGTPHPIVTKSLTTRAPAAVARSLVGYGFKPFFVLAPRAWVCKASLGEDGNYVQTIYNPKAGFFQVGGSTFQPKQAITYHWGSQGTNGPLFITCGFFPAATRLLRGLECSNDRQPYREQDSQAGLDLYTFEDPPGLVGNGDPSGGPNPANGIVVFMDAAESRRTGGHALNAGFAATCTLPQSKRAVCSAVLNDLIVRWPH